MAVDALMNLRALSAGARTSNGGSAAPFDLLTGTSRVVPLWMRFVVTTATTSSGSGAATFEVQHSDASGSGYTTLSSGAANALTLSTTDQTALIWIPFITNKRYLREYCTLSGTGASVTYKADVTVTKDGA